MKNQRYNNTSLTTGSGTGATNTNNSTSVGGNTIGNLKRRKCGSNSNSSSNGVSSSNNTNTHNKSGVQDVDDIDYLLLSLDSHSCEFLDSQEYLQSKNVENYIPPFGNSIVFACTFLISLIVYQKTVSPSIAGGDSGELVAEGCQLGTAHPPGYPLYTILVYVVTQMIRPIYLYIFFDSGSPFLPSPAYFVNLMSCFFGALASALIASSVFLLSCSNTCVVGNVSKCEPLTMKKGGGNNKKQHQQSPKSSFSSLLDSTMMKGMINVRFIGTFIRAVCSITTGLLHTISPLAWQYALTAEVFALHNFFVAILLNTTIQFAIHYHVPTNTTSPSHYLYLGAFLSGLSLTNQHTSILLVIPVIVWVLWVILGTHKKLPTKTELGMVLQCGILFCIGLIPLYISLIIIARIKPHAGSWGDLTHFRGFLHHLLRSDYGTFRLYSGDSSKTTKFLRLKGCCEKTLLWINDLYHNQTSSGLFVFGFFVFGLICLSKDITWGISNGIHVNGVTKKKTKSSSFKGNNSKRRAHPSNLSHVFPITTSSKTSGIGRFIITSLFFYLLIFHTLSNLPNLTSDKLFFGIHARFWMHPNIIFFIVCGVGMSWSCERFLGLLFIRSKMNKNHHHYISKSHKRNQQYLHNNNNNNVVCGLASLAFMFFISYTLIRSGYKQSIHVSDQTNNYIFQNYAKSILNSLPPNSLLFINYDQQWTSVRYMQECEAYRSQDIISINLSMMSYPWWKTKHELYRNHVTFPGSHYSNQNGGFSFRDLIHANIHNFDGGIYIGGYLNYNDEIYKTEFEEVPFGMVRRITPKEKNTNQSTKFKYLEEYHISSQNTWKKILEFLHIQNLPETSKKYSQETWEWTVKREFYDHLVHCANYILDLSVSILDEESSESEIEIDIGFLLKTLVESAAWLELATSLDMNGYSNQNPSLYKNLGIAYLHMVRMKFGDHRERPLPVLENIFNITYDYDDEEFNPLWLSSRESELYWNSRKQNWKIWASSMWQKSWKTFLYDVQESKNDDSYEQIEAIYLQVMKNSNRK